MTRNILSILLHRFGNGQGADYRNMLIISSFGAYPSNQRHSIMVLDNRRLTQGMPFQPLAWMEVHNSVRSRRYTSI